MVKNSLSYFLLIFPLFFTIFPLFFFDWSYVDEIIIGERQLSVYLHKPAIKNLLEYHKYCPLISKNLDSNFIKTYPFDHNLTHYHVSEAYWIQPGGKYKPKDCISRNKVAIIIPVQNREYQLSIIAPYLHSFMNGQLIEYQIFVVELSKENLFNKGILLNAGFVEALKIKNFTCFIFHDVDLLPENQQNTYSCFDYPRHLSVKVNSLRYILPYPSLFGGVFSLLTEDFQTVNGFSNRFFGWGGEDDEFFKRLQYYNYTILRSPDIGFYTTLPHCHSIINKKRGELIENYLSRFLNDGLNSLKYKLIETKRRITLHKIFNKDSLIYLQKKINYFHSLYKMEISLLLHFLLY